MGKNRFRRKGNLCECNCSGYAKPGRRFISGHNMKTPEQRKKQSENKTGKNNPFYGKKRPEHSKTMSGRKRPDQSERMKKNNPMNDPKSRKKVSESKMGDKNPSKRIEVRKAISNTLMGKYIGENHPNWKERIIIFCTTCKSSKKIYPKDKKEYNFCNYKCMGEWMSKNLIGENNPNWQGGISAEPYCLIWQDQEYKQDLKDRDNNECQNPDCWRKSNILMPHHIDYDKLNCHPWNIITVCNSCNSRANFKRNYWTKLYQNIMAEKHGYKYV